MTCLFDFLRKGNEKKESTNDRKGNGKKDSWNH